MRPGWITHEADETASVPDFASIYVVPDLEPIEDWDEATFGRFDIVNDHADDPILSPRQAATLWMTALRLSWDWEGAVAGDEVSHEELRDDLPPPVRPFATPEFLNRMRQCFDDIAERIAAPGVVIDTYSAAQCTGDDWALVQITRRSERGFDASLADFAEVLPEESELLAALPITRIDRACDVMDAGYIYAAVDERLHPDTHVFWLCALPENAFQVPPSDLIRAIEELDLLNLHPAQWFLPFATADEVEQRRIKALG